MGDEARRALKSLEMMADMAEINTKVVKVLTSKLLKEVLGDRSALFDNSVRGSASDAELY
ncbi:MAG: hypothetical protein G5663_06565 [Serratia symbiotica]|nr:hypothetical protein [Serratia symbiotica]